ncbi:MULTISPECIES: D-glycero-beta-D-manno-heptose 1-phosphate adenylyltransferase [Nostocales]|uniref:Bifunctional protein HldE n=3 Tax=Nostocales TaxID=1161 RepID=A0A0C1N8P2_9CYAN|nr:D-glycero-beta-D-manno-heptose 1-phosphate adenylyltransferase [Tolypothrix bouteillei]KAF3885355.1 D-glycero-beta-D-manno-heptose 1-phosphate adenylyltransferase [Tolypothrix bouteillei VB521301]
MKPDLLKLLDTTPNLHVIVIGEAMLDGYLEGFSDRLCPEAPVPVVTVKNRVYVPGGAANTAVNITSFGGQVTFLSVIGDDSEGLQLKRSLLEQGVSTTDLIVHPGRQTLAKQRAIAASQILLRIDTGTTNAIDGDTEQALIAKLQLVFPQCHAVIISDYGYGILTAKVIDAIAQLQQQHPRILVVDSKNLTVYRHLKVTAVKPNYEQTTQLLKIPPYIPIQNQEISRAEQITPYGEKLLDITGAKIVAVTLDTEGAIVFQGDSPPHRTYTQPTNQSRTAGAGDTYISALTLALASGAATPLAADFAASAAAIVVRKEGTTTCSIEELRLFLSSSSPTPPHSPSPALPLSSSPTLQKNITDTNQLITVIADYRKAGYKIVFTNGCFDILHAGHVSYLNRAKALGDILIIGVNSDNSIRRIKGETRPINSLEDRIQVLGGLACVDYLIAFNEDTPINLIRLVQPDIYVKGGDYTIETLPEAPVIQQFGGVVKLLPFLENRSTTEIIKKIIQNH